MKQERARALVADTMRPAARRLAAGLSPPRPAAAAWWALRGMRDEWAHLAKLESASTRRLLAQEDEYASRVLEPTVTLQMRLYDELAAAQPAAHQSEPEIRGEWAYYTRSPPRRDLPLFCRQHVRGGSEHVLLDLGALADRHGYAAIGKFAGSPDGRTFAYTLDVTGAEQWQLIVVDCATGGPATEPIAGVLNFEWADGGEALVYTSIDHRGRPCCALVHSLGSPRVRDRVLVEEADESHLLDVSSTKDGAWITLNSHSHMSSEVQLIPADGAVHRSGPLLVTRREERLHYFVEGLARGHLLLVGSTNERDGETETSAVHRASLSHGSACKSPFEAGLGLCTVQVGDLPTPRSAWVPLRASQATTHIEDVDVGNGWIAIYERRAAVPQISVARLKLPVAKDINGEHKIKASHARSVDLIAGTNGTPADVPHRPVI